jgi:phage terminase small subunit
LLRLGLLTEIDVHEFTMLCKMWDGFCIRPSAAMADAVSKRLSKFGCNPSDRSRIVLPGKPGSEDAMKRIIGG